MKNKMLFTFFLLNLFQTNFAFNLSEYRKTMGEPELEEPQLGTNLNATFRTIVHEKSFLWPRGVIPFTRDEFLPEELLNMEHALEQIQNATCIQFIRKRWSDKNYVHFEKTTGRCRTPYAMQGGKQIVKFSTGCTGSTHELTIQVLHILGLINEFNRKDRDLYVKINWADILPEYLGEFWRDASGTFTSFCSSYDYKSITHLKSRAYSRYGRVTVLPYHIAPEKVGSDTLSENDIKQIKMAYGCR